MESASLSYRTCPNCGSQEQQKYCPECGQKRRDNYSLKSIFSDAAEMFLGTDSRFFKTMRDYFQPGLYLKNWFDGKQSRYLSPVKIFLIINLFYFLFLSFLYNYGVGFNTFVTSFNGQLHQQVYSEWIQQGVFSIISERGLSLSIMADHYNSLVFTISNTLIIILAGIFSGFLYLINFNKTKLAYHHFNTGFYYSSFLLLAGMGLNFLIALSVLLSLGTTWTDNDAFSTTLLLTILAVFFGISQYRIFRDNKWVSATKGVAVALLAGFVGILVYRFILFWITLWSVLWFA